MLPLLCRARPGCVDFLSSIAQNLAVCHTFAPEFAVCSQRERPCSRAGERGHRKCKIAQKLPACKIGLYTLKSIRDALCCPHWQRQHRYNKRNICAVSIAAVLAAAFGTAAQLIFKNDGNMYRIPLGGRGAATARRLECNRQKREESKIEAKKCFLLFLHKAVEIWQIM